MWPKIEEITTVLLPSGRDYTRCREAFQEMYGTSAPDFKGRQLHVQKDGKRFIKVKGKDIPMFIAKGYGDLGITSSDVFNNSKLYSGNIHHKHLGQAICTFELLIPKAKHDDIMRRLFDKSQPAVSVATSFPKLLQSYAGSLNITVEEVIPSGSVEAMPQLGIAEIAADAVASGETAEANDLLRVYLDDVHPTAIWRTRP